MSVVFSNPSDITIKSIRFFTPVTIDYDVTTGTQTENFIINGGLDLAHQEISLSTELHDKNLKELLKERVFEFISGQVALPEDKYEAGAEVYEQAARAQEAKDMVTQAVGEQDYV